MNIDAGSGITCDLPRTGVRIRTGQFMND